MDNLSFDTVIIVACVCGGVVLILTIVLIVLCCQRRRSKDLYEKTETNIIEPAMTSAETNFTNDGNNEEQRSDELLSSHQPQRHKDDPKRPGELGKEFGDGHKSSNPNLAGNTSYPSLNHIAGGGGGSSSALQVSSASSADDKRPRKVIYEVIV